MNTQNTIDLGSVGWRLPSVEGISFGGRDGALAYAAREGKDVAGLALVDTRPTIKAVAEQLRIAEGCEGDPRWGTVGPWDEYFSVAASELKYSEPAERWPHGYHWISVFVVVGGSEGLYLHVEAITGDTRRLLIIGKTCGGGRDTWMKCYESAARISWLLNCN